MGILKNRKNRNNNNSNTSGLVAARVLDVILDINHPKAKELGEYDAIGTIFFSILDKNDHYQNKNSSDHAKPLFSYIKDYPLINEVVLILSANDKGIYDKKSSKSFYYLSQINIWNHPHHNALPTSKALEDEPTSNDYQKRDNGITRKVTDGSTDINLGKYFKEELNIKPLLPYEGDMILEGRFGNSIRFGSTNRGDSIPEKNQNQWSKTGETGDPITIIRNGQKIEEDSEGWIPTTENSNEDSSAIYMTSNQQITGFTPASLNNQSFGANLKTTNTFKQIIDSPEIIEPTNVPPKVDDDDEEVVIIPETIVDTPVIEPEKDDEEETEINPFDEYTENIETGEYIMSTEDIEVSGTELSEEEKQTESNTIENPQEGEFVRGEGGTPTICKNKEQTTTAYNEWKDGKIDYPIHISPHRGDVMIIDPYPVSELISKLKSDGVNSSKLSKIENLCIHVTATDFQDNIGLSNYFAYFAPSKTGGWSRHGYNISIDDEGGCNYNVDLIKKGHSYGIGGNGYTSTRINGLLAPNSKTINISWIGTNKTTLSKPNLSPGKTNNPNITQAQAYAIENLCRYFIKAFPDIKIFGHNQITIKKGYGKSCPTWDNVKYCELIGIPDKNIYKTHIHQLSMSDKKKLKDYADIIKDYSQYTDETLSNFSSFYGTTYQNTAQYVYNLTNKTSA